MNFCVKRGFKGFFKTSWYSFSDLKFKMSKLDEKLQIAKERLQSIEHEECLKELGKSLNLSHLKKDWVYRGGRFLFREVFIYDHCRFKIVPTYISLPCPVTSSLPLGKILLFHHLLFNFFNQQICDEIDRQPGTRIKHSSREIRVTKTNNDLNNIANWSISRRNGSKTWNETWFSC